MNYRNVYVLNVQPVVHGLIVVLPRPREAGNGSTSVCWFMSRQHMSCPASVSPARAGAKSHAKRHVPRFAYTTV